MNKVTTVLELESIPVENGVDVILALLYIGGKRKAINEEIEGNTRLEKLIFLIEQETILKKYLTNFNYEPYNFGPYSSEVFDAIEALINAGLVNSSRSSSVEYLDEVDRYQIEYQSGDDGENSKNTIIYSLTSEGIKVASALLNSLTPQERNEITMIKTRYNSIGLKQLLQYVYRKYPKYTTESVIKDHIF
jgi:uncharacterized protein YwgA